MVYLPTFTIKISQMLVNTSHMDPMGFISLIGCFEGGISSGGKLAETKTIRNFMPQFFWSHQKIRQKSTVISENFLIHLIDFYGKLNSIQSYTFNCFLW